MRAQPIRQKRKDVSAETASAQLGRGREATLPVLKMVQDANQSYLDSEKLGAVSDALGVNDAHTQGVATFYAMLSTRPRPANILRVCDGPVCMLHGAEAVLSACEAKASGGDWSVERWSCLGLCDRAPAVLRQDEPAGPLAPDQVQDLLAGVRKREPMPQYAQPLPGEMRVAMARLGKVDPDSIDSALAEGAYRNLGTALAGSPDSVLDAVEQSGLRGCGGAGYPVGLKWRAVARAKSGRKYIICNADESEPGTFKDRVLMESDPHLLLEAMALAGHAVGAREGIIYIRGEYEWISRRLERAIAQAEERGWLGERIQNSAFSFDIHVHRGAGAYICGEESALLESLEGKRGEPRIRPPYPTTHGYQGQPTVINNVETFCLVPAIIARGPEWFRSLGTESSPGTKMFTVTGCVNRPGAFEVPLGITLRQIIDQFAGGMRNGGRFKAALTGGAAGTIVPESLIDVPIDFTSSRQGIALGSGAMMILDESVLIPRFLSWLLHFFARESCGKCTPCRVGTHESTVIGERMAGGAARPEDGPELSRLAHQMELTSLCGLGKSVALPVVSALHHFADEFHPATEEKE